MKRKKIISAVIVLVVAVLTPRICHAQEDYRFDMGAGVGMTGYLGDANTANLFQNPGVTGELLFRYIANPRFAFKTNFFVGSLRGNSAQMTNVFPDAKQFKFSTTFYELGEVAEFNFFSYGMGETYRKLKRWSPYICAGVSLMMWQSQDKGTEGAPKKLGVGVAIPFGGGVKFKVNKRLNLGLEFLMKKTFTDRLDTENLKDPYEIKSSFMKNTDWYSTLTFSVTYEFSKRCEVCHYKE